MIEKIRLFTKFVLKRFFYPTLIKTSLFKRDLSFISFADACNYCDNWIKEIPRDYDVIVGIPRSGLFVANILALKLGKPLATPGNLSNIWQSKHLVTADSPKKFLLVDDSYRTGNSMDEALAMMLNLGVKRDNIATAALIVGKKGAEVLDHHYCVIERGRFFEWNMLHRKVLLATDMDGVLCEDPPPQARDSELIYKKWLIDAKPYLIPFFEIECIITSRIEKYRKETEFWLQKNNVRYKSLIMSKESTREAQRSVGLNHKIVALQLIKPDIYWESSTKEGVLIKASVKCPILLIDQKNIII